MTRQYPIQTRLRGTTVMGWRLGFAGAWRWPGGIAAWIRPAIGTGSTRRLNDGTTITTAWVER